MSVADKRKDNEMTKTVLTQADIDKVLNSSIGTQHWYREPLSENLVYTDGIKYMAEELGMYWFIGVVGTHMDNVMEVFNAEKETFFTVELAVDDSNRAVFTINQEKYNAETEEYTDVNIAYQELTYADLPQCEMKFFLELAQWEDPTIFCLLQRSEH